MLFIPNTTFMSLSFKTIMFYIVLGIFLPTAYFMDYKDGHREDETVKARDEQADRDTAEWPRSRRRPPYALLV
jgi:hypothetical protein